MIYYKIQPRHLLIFAVLLAHVQVLRGSTCTTSTKQRYKTSCELFGWGRCTRYRTVYHSTCCSGWTGSGCSTPICPGSCNGVGTCYSPDECSCPVGYYSNRCRRCRAIQNCDRVSCSTSSDQRCLKCNGQYGNRLGNAYLPSSDGRRCVKQCSWRSDSGSCWPGSCSRQGVCRCSPSFRSRAGNSRDCSKLSTKSTLSDHRAKLHVEGSVIEAPSTIDTDTTYTNVRISNVQNFEVSSTSNYQPSGLPHSSSNPYVNNYGLGITNVKAIYTLKGRTIPLNCPNDGSQLSPMKIIVECNMNSASRAFASMSIRSGDRLECRWEITNGGFLMLYNRDSRTQSSTETHYYEGTTLTMSESFTFDYDDPEHCVETVNCDVNMLTFGEDVTTQPNLRISWTDWTDTTAGIYRYHLEVRKMSVGSGENQLTEVYTETPIYNGYTRPGENILLLTSGVYSIVLVPEDKAGNTQITRRFVLFDNETPGPTINYGELIRVTSDRPDTDPMWITTHNGPSSSISLDWTNHFQNEKHHNRGFLRPIGPHKDYTISNAYDDNFGRRNREEILNANGVTEFRVHVQRDHNRGTTIQNPSNRNTATWNNMTWLTLGSFPVSVIDGDSVRFWIYAEDRMRHGVTDTALFHVDSSPPQIEYLYLTRDGRVNLAVHNATQLQDMRIQFQTYDMHSGLYSIQWQFMDHEDNTVLQEGSRPVVKNPAKCNTGSCICIPSADCYETDYEFSLPGFELTKHDYDFLISITVTNHAKLVTNRMLKVTVDVSPPIAGAVQDGLRGSNERDFQSEMELSVYWDGFFDKESGIMFYKYVFDTRCWNKDEFGDEKVVTTSSTNAHWVAPNEDTYWVTVVAYNRALEPSLPVCSDGITIDTTEPLLSDVNIKNARMKSGFAKNGEGEIWFIESDLTRRAVVNVTDICRNTVAEADIMLYVESKTPLMDVAETSANCHGIVNKGNLIYLATDQHIYLSWQGMDNESSIFSYAVGLSSDSASSTPDIIPFVSTAGQNDYVINHPNIAQGSMFYILLKATNRAQMITTKIIGPIVINTTPPTFFGNIQVNTTVDSFKIRWDKSAFEDDFDDALTFEIAIGHKPYGTDTMQFQELKKFPLSGCLEDYICADIQFNSLNFSLHTDHVFHVTVKAKNTVLLFVLATSAPIRYYQQIPYKGVVFDISKPTNDDVYGFKESQDVDVQISQTTIAARWFGFAHPHLEIDYEFGVGTSQGLTDVTTGYVHVGENTFHEECCLSLENQQTYYVTIRATTNTGYVEVSSDGITVLLNKTKLIGVIVNDGLSCQSDVASDVNDIGGTPCTTTDVEFQATTSVAESYWRIPKSLLPFINKVYWSLEEQISGNDWKILIDYQDIGHATYHIEKGMFLSNGGFYRSTVKLCHFTVCFQPISSNGVVVLSSPPVPGTVQVEVVRDSLAEEEISDIEVYFQPFQHNIIPTEFDSIDLMDYYEWTTSDATNRLAIHSPWARIDNVEQINNQVHFRASLETKYDYSRCIFIIIRGYNKAGLSTSVQKELVNCDPAAVVLKPNTVLDASQHIYLKKHEPWKEPDAEYSSNATALFAIWPTLRHGSYDWAVIEENTDQDFLVQLANGLQAVCDHQMTIICGHAENEFINIIGLSLKHGRRYHICIHAYNTTRTYEKWEQVLPEISTCSDGVVIDTTPPSPGKVWIGWDTHIQFQRSTSDIVIRWNHFTDIEEHGHASHHYGIIHYEYAIGTSPGGSDVLNFKNVGITDHTIVTGLHLESGHVYYAAVRGTDFVRLSTTSVSPPVLVDNSQPVVIPEIFINMIGSRAIWTSTDNVAASWAGAFADSQSGIAYYHWSVGSQPGHADIIPFIWTVMEQDTSYLNAPLRLHEGHSYYVTIKATNRARLSNTCVLGPYLVDASPPLGGQVYDGSPASQTRYKKDQDFQTDLSVLHAFWEGFHDPHSTIVRYDWTIGLCKGCDDILSHQSVGISEFAFADHLLLVSGFRYFVTVTACNVADLCTSVTSDGILLDNSPPVAGHVYDGTHGGDIDFSSSKYHLATHWWGFHDAHSGIHYYQWRAGTTRGGDDIFSVEHIQRQETAFRLLVDPLPTNVHIYITVRAYNMAGLWIEAISDGFIVDTSPPRVLQPVSRVNDVGVIVLNTQVIPDVVRFTWLLDDQESGIRQQYVTMDTHLNGDVEVIPIKINPSDTNYTFTELKLHDGARYTIHVISCNGAHRCSRSSSAEFLVDSSPPTTGTFAIDSDHAANLLRQRPSTMVWRIDSANLVSYLDLAWLGFADCHSGIDYYSTTIGYSYDTYELTQDTVLRLEHSRSDAVIDEGVVQTYSIRLNGSIDLTRRIYVSIWGINGVGLKSSRAHAAFDLAQSAGPIEGPLVLVRRCESHSCEGHCICAPGNTLCSDGSINHCRDVTKNNPNAEIMIYDVLDIKKEALSIFGDKDVDYVPTKFFVAAKWKTTVIKGLPILRYEWSIGRHSANIDGEPEGVFDPAYESLWHDVAHDTSVVVTLQNDKMLRLGVQYDFFVRTWYSDDTFAVFQSDGVTSYSRPLKPVILLGANVKDFKSSTSSDEIDFTSNANAITIDWFQVFASKPEALSLFEVALGTFPGGENIAQFADHIIDPDQYQITLSMLNLQNGTLYFSSVRAFTKSGLHTTSVSDGFIVDTTPPRTGLVNDGLGLYDLEYQNSTSMISASWHGFVDLESYIDSYEWCVGNTEDTVEASVMHCINVGLHVSASREITPALVSGTRYFSKVFAINAAGLRSFGAVSNGFIADITPPRFQHITGYGKNLVENPSFENVTGERFRNATSMTDENVMTAWLKVEESSDSAVTQSKDIVAYGGDYVVALRGKISQTIETCKGKQYEITFVVSHIPFIRNTLNQEGLLEVPGVKEVFMLYDKPATAQFVAKTTIWQRHVFHFTAQTDDTELSITSLGQTSGLLLDSVEVRQLEFETSVSNNSVNVEITFIHGWSSVQATWHFRDDESPVVEYYWAIGNVAKGTQLQNFQSVGKRTTSQNRNLKMAHGSSIYVTVTATNKAELTSVAYSDECIVDLTEPVIYDVYCGVKAEKVVKEQTNDAGSGFLTKDEGSGLATFNEASGLSIKDEGSGLALRYEGSGLAINEEGSGLAIGDKGSNNDNDDFNFQTRFFITASWRANDDESGIQHCDWAIGLEPGTVDVIGRIRHSQPPHNVSTYLPDDFAAGQTTYINVWCTNGAGLSTHATSKGVTIAKEVPDSSRASVNINFESVTGYFPRDGFQSSSNDIAVSWQGFIDQVGITSYECQLLGPSISWNDWVKCGSAAENTADFTGLSLTSTASYMVNVRAVNVAGLVSDYVSQNVSVLTTKPLLSERKILTQWGSNDTLTFSWADVFLSPSTLVYEISLGTIQGAGDVLLWTETMETEMWVTPVLRYTDYYLTLTAINGAGLFSTENEIIIG